MGINDYFVNNDKFEFDENAFDFYFPCCACIHRKGRDCDEPCVRCDHNIFSINKDFSQSTNEN